MKMDSIKLLSKPINSLKCGYSVIFLLLLLISFVSPADVSASRIGDLIWLDWNCNGIQDNSESGIAGVTLVLYEMDGDGVYEKLAETTSIDKGFYLFSNPFTKSSTVHKIVVIIDKSNFLKGGPLYGYTPTTRFAGVEEIDSNGFWSDDSVSSGLFDFVQGTELPHWTDYTIDFGFCLLPESDCSKCEGKVTQLTLRYDGTTEALITVEQKKEGKIFDETVEPGAEFTISGRDKHGTLGTEISIYIGAELNTKIHTSCSKPIGPGLVFGDFTIIEGYSREGGLLCPWPSTQPPGDGCSKCEGKVTQLTLQYNGTSNALITVEQKKEGVIFEGDVGPGAEFTINGEDKHGTLGTEISIYIDEVLNTKIHTSCSKPIGPGIIFGDFTIIEGYSRKGGFLCPLPPSQPPEDDCSKCEGKVTQLTLLYNGTTEALITVEQKKEGKIFDETVKSDEEFTIKGRDKHGTLGTEISIYIEGVLNTKIHTSCSKPIGPGLVFGDFTIIEGYSHKGGLLCEVSSGSKTGKSQSNDHHITTTQPKQFILFQNYANPFNPSTEIRFQLGEDRYVVLKIFNALGQEVNTLVNSDYQEGLHTVRWDGNDEMGNPVAGGVYLYQIRAGEFTEVKTMSLIR